MANPVGITRANFLSPAELTDGVLHDINLKGGFQAVKTIVDRNAIPTFANTNTAEYDGFGQSDDVWSSGRRRVGMLVYVIEENKFYQLVPVGYFGNGGNEEVNTPWETLEQWKRALRIDPTGTYSSGPAGPPTFDNAPQSTAVDLGIAADANSCWVERQFWNGVDHSKVFEFYAPDATHYKVNDDSEYEDAANNVNPTLYVTKGETYVFKRMDPNHPLRIRSANGDLVAGVQSGSLPILQGADLVWKVPQDATGVYTYECDVHPAMTGQIVVCCADGAPAPTATPEPTATEVPPTATPEPTATEVPATPTPTATAVPPTATPEPTATEVPATPTPTATEVPPTATPEPTATEVPATPTPTATEVPATPTPTATEVPATPTPTATEVPPTPTPTATSFVSVPLWIHESAGKGDVAQGSCKDAQFQFYADQAQYSDVMSAVVGDDVFEDANLAVPFNGGNAWYTVADDQGQQITQFRIANNGNIEEIVICEPDPTPTPTATEVPPTATPEPTATPTSTPMASQFWVDAGSGSGDIASNTPCQDVSVPVWIAGINSLSQITGGELVYANVALTASFSGGGLWYDLGDTSGGAPSFKVLIRNGAVDQIADCPLDPTATPVPTATATPVPPTPTPTATPVPTATATPVASTQYYIHAPSGEGNTATTDQCQAVSIPVWSPDAVLTVGSTIWTNSSLTNSFNGAAQFYTIDPVSGTIPSIQYSIRNGAIEAIYDCAQVTPTPTPEPEPTPTATPSAEASTRTIYYFHGGQGEAGFPYATKPLTDSGAQYYIPTDTSGGATLSDAMNYLITNGGGDDPYYGGAGAFSMNSFVMPAGHSITDNLDPSTSTSWTFPANALPQYNYLAVPNTEEFTEDLRSPSPQYLLYNGLPTNATTDRKAFTYAGVDYWLYRMGNGSITGSSNFGFNN